MHNTCIQCLIVSWFFFLKIEFASIVIAMCGLFNAVKTIHDLC